MGSVCTSSSNSNDLPKNSQAQNTTGAPMASTAQAQGMPPQAYDPNQQYQQPPPQQYQQMPPQQYPTQQQQPYAQQPQGQYQQMPPQQQQYQQPPPQQYQQMPPQQQAGAPQGGEPEPQYDPALVAQAQAAQSDPQKMYEFEQQQVQSQTLYNGATPATQPVPPAQVTVSETVMLPAPSEIPWQENADLKWDSDQVSDDQWHQVALLPTPDQLACMDELEASIEWKGNMDSNCKFAFIRNGQEVKGVQPFGFPTEGYTQPAVKLHVLYNHDGLMGHYRPGDKIGIFFKVGFGANRLKIRNLHVFMKGRMAQTQTNAQGQQVIVQQQRQRSMVPALIGGMMMGMMLSRMMRPRYGGYGGRRGYARAPQRPPGGMHQHRPMHAGHTNVSVSKGPHGGMHAHVSHSHVNRGIGGGGGGHRGGGGRRH